MLRYPNLVNKNIGILIITDVLQRLAASILLPVKHSLFSVQCISDSSFVLVMSGVSLAIILKYRLRRWIDFGCKHSFM